MATDVGDVSLRPYNAPYINEDDIPLTNLTFTSSQDSQFTTRGAEPYPDYQSSFVETDELSDSPDFEFLYQVMKKKHIGNYEPDDKTPLYAFIEIEKDRSIEAVEFSQTFTLRKNRTRFRLKNDGNVSNMLRGLGYTDLLTGVDCSIPCHLEICSKSIKSKKLALFHDCVLGYPLDVVFDTDDIPDDLSVTIHMSILSSKIRDDIRDNMPSLKWNGIIYK